MRKSAKASSGINALEEDLRAAGELPPSNREPLKELRRRGELPPLPRRPIVRKTKPDDVAITPIEYGGLQAAFDYLNRALFDGTLPDCFITYQRRAHSRGYFSPDRFSARVGEFKKPEIALNPDTFVDRTDEQIVSTLAHEMTHNWQQAFGKPSARGYHNKEWAAKMKAVGLQPSSTGAVGGKETGQSVSHYIIPDGPFTEAFAKLAATGWRLNLQSAHQPGGKRAPSSKVKSTCSVCGGNAWAKPNYQLACVACGNIPMLAEVQSYDQAA